MLVEIHWHDMIISLPYIPPASVFNALVLTLPIYLSRFVVKSLITKVHDIQSSIICHNRIDYFISCKDLLRFAVNIEQSWNIYNVDTTGS